jgi:hypothetical protein
MDQYGSTCTANQALDGVQRRSCLKWRIITVNEVPRL